MKKMLAALLLILMAGTVAAQQGDDAIREALAGLVPGLPIESIKDSPIDGYKEVQAGALLVYVSDDGKYLLDGQLIEIASRRNLTEASRSVIRKDRLQSIPDDQSINFAPADAPKHSITVFTDIDCGYCRKLHQEMAQYNDLGIEVKYLFFPRSGVGSHSHAKAVSVWCADDANGAMTHAKSGAEPEPVQCANPVEEHYELGKQIGVTGTPALFTEDGTMISGYVPAAQLLSRLDQMSAASSE